MLTEPVPPLFPKATIPSGYSYPQTNGYEPRFGVACRVSDRTVLRSAFAIIDDHNRIVQAEGGSLNLCWPTAGPLDVTLQNCGLPNLFIDALPAAASLIDPLVPLVSQSFDPNAKIPYSIEYNFGIERQLPSSMVLKVDYVGSVSRH
jgi:hypothetical protein